MTDLVVISLEPWDGVWRRNQHLVSRLLSRDHALRVLFVEPPADPMHDLRARRAPQFGFAPRVKRDVSPRLWTMRPTKALPRRLDRYADQRIAASIQRAAGRLGMTAPVLWINDPAAAGVMRRTGWPTLYDITDDWAVADRAPRERDRIVAGERMLVEHAAQVVACSPELVRRKQPERPPTAAPIVLIRNAVDVAAYRAPHPRPPDLPDGPVALYAGTLHSDRLDVDLCVRTAQALSGHAALVFVGPNALREADTRRLRESGAVLLGSRPYTDIPAYLQHADVLVVPHRVDAFTDSLDPIKLYEYQAAGRRIVSTSVAGFRDGDTGALVADGASFPQAVLRGFAQPTYAPHRSTETESTPDWSIRTDCMYSVIDRINHQSGTNSTHAG